MNRAKRQNAETHEESLQLTDTPRSASKRLRRDYSPSKLKRSDKSPEVSKRGHLSNANYQKWTPEEKDIFFEAVLEYGRGFEEISKFFELKRKKKPTIGVKDKGQCRHFYLRTLRRISSFRQIKLDSGIKKRIEEVLLMINYNEIRKRTEFTEKSAVKLNQLLHMGMTTLKVNGKTVRIRTPTCTYIKMLMGVNYAPPEPIPPVISVEFIPKSVHVLTSFKTIMQNPNTRISVPSHRKLTSVIDLVEQKWQSRSVKFTNIVSTETVPAPQLHLLLSLPKDCRVYPLKSTLSKSSVRQFGGLSELLQKRIGLSNKGVKDDDLSEEEDFDTIVPLKCDKCDEEVCECSNPSQNLQSAAPLGSPGGQQPTDDKQKTPDPIYTISFPTGMTLEMSHYYNEDEECTQQQKDEVSLLQGSFTCAFLKQCCLRSEAAGGGITVGELHTMLRFPTVIQFEYEFEASNELREVFQSELRQLIELSKSAFTRYHKESSEKNAVVTNTNPPLARQDSASTTVSSPISLDSMSRSDNRSNNCSSNAESHVSRAQAQIASLQSMGKTTRMNNRPRHGNREYVVQRSLMQTPCTYIADDAARKVINVSHQRSAHSHSNQDTTSTSKTQDMVYVQSAPLSTGQTVTMKVPSRVFNNVEQPTNLNLSTILELSLPDSEHFEDLFHSDSIAAAMHCADITVCGEDNSTLEALEPSTSFSLITADGDFMFNEQSTDKTKDIALFDSAKLLAMSKRSTQSPMQLSELLNTPQHVSSALIGENSTDSFITSKQIDSQLELMLNDHPLEYLEV